MEEELKLCAHNNHPEQSSHPHRQARVPTLHFKFHKISIYIRKGKFQPDFSDMQADLSPIKCTHTVM